MFMAWILKNLRLLRSNLMLLLLTMIFVVPMYSQNHAALLAELGPQAISLHPESNQIPTQGPQPEVFSRATPEEMRQAQIEADTKTLYQLSAELRAEVAKTYKESLSIAVLKKAEEIEKLARSLKALMSQEAAAAR
jgi:hypothetical protein